MVRDILKVLVVSALFLAAYGKDEDEGSKKTTTPPAAGGSDGKNDKNYVFQTPPFGGYRGRGLYGGYGSYGGYGGLYGNPGFFGNYGRVQPVPVTGVKALSVAYDPVSGVPYMCDPNKKDSSAAGGASPGGAPGGPPSAPGAPAGKRDKTEAEEIEKDETKEDEAKKDELKGDDSEKDETKKDEKTRDETEKDEMEGDETKKDEVKVKVPDYPPCPDPKKSFPWSCLLGDKSSTKRECVRAKKAVAEASKRWWPYTGWAGAHYPLLHPITWGGPFGYGPYGYGGGYLFG